MTKNRHLPCWMAHGPYLQERTEVQVPNLCQMVEPSRSKASLGSTLTTTYKESPLRSVKPALLDQLSGFVDPFQLQIARSRYELVFWLFHDKLWIFVSWLWPARADITGHDGASSPRGLHIHVMTPEPWRRLGHRTSPWLSPRTMTGMTLASRWRKLLLHQNRFFKAWLTRYWRSLDEEFGYDLHRTKAGVSSKPQASTIKACSTEATIGTHSFPVVINGRFCSSLKVS